MPTIMQCCSLASHHLTLSFFTYYLTRSVLVCTEATLQLSFDVPLAQNCSEEALHACC